MSPLSAIPNIMPGQGLMPRASIGPAEGSPMPGVQMPGIEGAPDVAGVQGSNNSFANVLGKMVEDVNTKQSAAADAVSNLQSGGNVSLHQAVIAMEEANVSFQLMVEVRNKLLESYQEIMRMQV